MNIDDGLEDRDEIKRQISNILGGFNHLVVTNRWKESIIILAAYLNIPVEHIAVPARKVASDYPRGPLTTKQQAILNRIYRLDYLVYEVSNQLLDAKISGKFLL